MDPLSYSRNYLITINLRNRWPSPIENLVEEKHYQKSTKSSQFIGKLFNDAVMRKLLTFLIVVSLSRKLTFFPDPEENSRNLKNVHVSAEITVLPEKLCFVWTATRDVVLRKFNLPKFHRYGLDFQINRNNASTLICILLCGDVETNPGPSLNA